MKNKFTYYAPALAWGFFMTYMTLLPADEVPQGLKDMNDKILHAGIFFFTASLIIAAGLRYNLRRRLKPAQYLKIFLLCVVYGGAIELLQYYYVPLREGDWFDFWANNSGALLAVLCWSLFTGRKA